jgi:putative transposase
MLDSVHDMVGGQNGFQQILVITNGDKITVADLEGEILIEHTRPAPGITYVGNGQPRGLRPKTDQTSPKS